jgi:protein-L-isoaspartate(D-aspartate) O-methyltransferase
MRVKEGRAKMLYDEELDNTLLREKRFRMVEDQIRMRSIHDKRVLEAMKRVPRHLFLDDVYWEIAYGDHPVPIGFGKTTSQPYMIGLMLQCLDLRPHHKVLEIGTGSGYQAGLISEISAQIYTVEKNQKLTTSAQSRFKGYTCSNVKCSCAKKGIGWQGNAPYDRILISGAVTCVPTELIKQLGPKGVIVTVLGRKSGTQKLVKIIKSGDTVSVADVAEVCNVSMITGHKLTPFKEPE